MVPYPPRLSLRGSEGRRSSGPVSPVPSEVLYLPREVTAAAVHHATAVLDRPALVVTASARLHRRREGMGGLKGCVEQLAVEHLGRVPRHRAGEPAAPLRPFFGE